LEIVKESAKTRAESDNDRFSELEKRLCTMEWEAVERWSENDRLSAALAKLIDRNWSQDKKLNQALDRVRDLESRVEGTEALLKESHTNQTALDVEVIGLQQRMEELELEMKWTRGIADQHSASFDDFGAQVEELEAFVDRQEAANTYNEHMFRGLSGRINWSFRREGSLATRISDLEDEVQLESHCCHCPSSGSEVERGPSGWEPRSESVPWPTRADVDREILEDEEMVDMRVRRREIESESLEEEAYELASPATAPSVSLRPVSPLVVSESEETGVSHWGRGPLETGGNMSGTLKGEDPFTWCVTTNPSLNVPTMYPCVLYGFHLFFECIASCSVSCSQ